MTNSYILILSFLLSFAITGKAQLFQNVNIEVGIAHYFQHQQFIGGGVAIFDYNMDGLEDIYLTGGKAGDMLYKNNGNHSFTEVSKEVGIAITENFYTTSVTTGDIDNDGYREIIVGTWYKEERGENRNLLFKNNRDGTFTEIGQQAGINGKTITMSIAMVDINLDSYLDIYCTNYIEKPGFIFDSTGTVIGFDHQCAENLLFINNGDNTFEESAKKYGVNDAGCGFATAVTDIDLDNDLDLILLNDFGHWGQPNLVYRNDYPATKMTNIAPEIGLEEGFFAMGVGIGDYDRDQDLDYYMTNIGANYLMQKDGNSFRNQSKEMGIENQYAFGFEQYKIKATSWGAAFMDYDNDSWLDLFVSNGFIPTNRQNANAEDDANQMFKNLGNGNFENVSTSLGLNHDFINRGFAYTDFDQDGDLDLVVVGQLKKDGQYSSSVISFKGYPTLVLENKLNNQNNWIQLQLQGVLCNRDAFGAKIKLFAGGEIFIHEIAGGGSSHASQHSSIAHFGLGNIDKIDKVEIYWPGQSIPQIVKEVKKNKKNLIIQNQKNVVFK